jgi:shikimate kinase
MRIFLTGMMGCGKTFWGKKIADELRWPFIDLDEYIQEKMHLTIAEIFRQESEDFFRLQEKKYLTDLIAAFPEGIIATGGGTPCFFDNLAVMKKAGRVVYLKTEPATLAASLRKAADKRPLLNAPAQDLTLQLEELLLQRKIFYEQSDLIIEMNQTDETNFAEIFKHL